MNIQDKMQEIHHKFGVTEKANYEIQLFVDDLIKKDRAEQLTLTDVVFSEAELKAKLEEQLEETRQWLIGEDFEGLAERL
jgi:hypothetical protein